MTGDGDGTARRPTKSAAAFRTISEVADELDVPQHVLRFWETKFSQVRPLKRGGRRRYYRPEDIALLRRIKELLYVSGYTIKGVQRLLREVGSRAVVEQTASAEAGRDNVASQSRPASEPSLDSRPAAASHAGAPVPGRAPDADRRAALGAVLDELDEARRLLSRAE